MCYTISMNRLKRPIIIENDVAKVPVYCSGVILYAVIDKEDVGLVEDIFWSSDKRGYARGNNIYLHRHILKPPTNKQVDHINGNRLDNRRANLRLATNQQNQMARHVVVGKSGYKGVHKHGKKWRAQIKYNGKLVRLGSYETPERAAKAYDQAAKALFGEWGVLNGDFHYTRPQVER